MDEQEKVRELFLKGAIILCLDVPNDGFFEFGIDLLYWRTGKNFKGIKMIPPGVHYIYYSVANKYGGESAPRTSMLLNLEAGSVVVFKWDPVTEDLIHLSRSDASPYVEGARNFDFENNLGEYPLDLNSKWRSLSKYISQLIVEKLRPIGNKIDSTTKSITPQEVNQFNEALENIGVSQEDIGKELKSHSVSRIPFYSSIPRYTTKKATPEEVTKNNMDKSHTLETLIKNEYNYKKEDFLGEIQFAFICFLIGHSFESFEQWKSLILIVLSSERLIYEKEWNDFFLSTISVITGQLKQIPSDFFLDIVSGRNFLHFYLKGFVEILADEMVDEGIKNAGEKLVKYYEKKFGISLSSIEGINDDDDDDDDEYSPTYVKM